MLCPNCDKTIIPEEIAEHRKYLIKGEDVEIDDRINRCPECNEEWSQEGFDFASEAYRIYRTRHHMLQPEEIKNFRKSLTLTQEELANLMGWSESTVNRYEKGALQERSHDNALRMAMTRDGLRSLLEIGGSVLPPKKHARLLTRCSEIRPIEFEDIVFLEQSERTGFCLFSSAKFKAAVGILTSVSTGVWQTTLNKLLWYSDFLHFKEQGVGITGLVYVRLPYGPAPGNYKLLMALLPENDFVFEPFEFDNECSGERLHALTGFDRSIFSKSELRVLEAVRDKLGKSSASEISKISHEETAWANTPPNDFISYQLAKEIKFSI
jgi:putative zinc finger/helix-turn-helix YgiT family protein